MPAGDSRNCNLRESQGINGNSCLHMYISYSSFLSKRLFHLTNASSVPNKKLLMLKCNHRAHLWNWAPCLYTSLPNLPLSIRILASLMYHECMSSLHQTLSNSRWKMCGLRWVWKLNTSLKIYNRFPNVVGKNKLRARDPQILSNLAESMPLLLYAREIRWSWLCVYVCVPAILLLYFWILGFWYRMSQSISIVNAFINAIDRWSTIIHENWPCIEPMKHHSEAICRNCRCTGAIWQIYKVLKVVSGAKITCFK